MSNEQRKRRSRRKPKEQLTYTEPKSFNKKKFVLTLGIVLGTVLALFFVMSLFFKVGNPDEKVFVSGNTLYTRQEVIEAAGIHQGDSLLNLNRAQLRARILQKLPYVSTVRIGIKLPDTIKIEVTESAVQYSVESVDGNWWLMDAEGKILSKTNWVDAKDYTQCLGLRIQVPQIGQQVVGVDPEPTFDEEGNPVPPLLDGGQCMETMSRILKLLEKYGILDGVTGVNMDDPGHIYIVYDDGFRIKLGDHQNMEKKLSWALATMAQLEENRTGTIDVSFAENPNQAIFTPVGD